MLLLFALQAQTVIDEVFVSICRWMGITAVVGKEETKSTMEVIPCFFFVIIILLFFGWLFGPVDLREICFYGACGVHRRC